jgi:hypothetical protein
LVWRWSSHARCSTGTSCAVPEKVEIAADQEVSWEARIETTRGKKLVSGFKVCLDGKGPDQPTEQPT